MIRSVTQIGATGGAGHWRRSVSSSASMPARSGEPSAQLEYQRDPTISVTRRASARRPRPLHIGHSACARESKRRTLCVQEGAPPSRRSGMAAGPIAALTAVRSPRLAEQGRMIAETPRRGCPTWPTKAEPGVAGSDRPCSNVALLSEAIDNRRQPGTQSCHVERSAVHIGAVDTNHVHKLSALKATLNDVRSASEAIDPATWGDHWAYNWTSGTRCRSL